MQLRAALTAGSWPRLGHRPEGIPRLTREGGLLLALLALDTAMVARAGYVSDLSVVALGATFAMLLIARTLPTGPAPGWLWAGVTGALALSLLVANFTRWPQGWPVWIFVIAGLAAAALAATGKERIAVAVAGLGFLIFLSVCWRWDPSQIDVLYGLRSAGHALLGGHNPYLPVHPSTTPGEPALVHFTYGPVVAVLAALGLLFGDPRVVSVLSAAALAAALFRLSRQRSEGWRLALTVCVAPLMVAMIVFAWPMLLAMAGIAWWLVLRPGHRRVATVILGLVAGCALIQVGPLLLVLFLRSRKLMAEMLVATGIGLAIVGAFAWWTGFERYWYYTIGIHFHGAVGVGTLSLAGILTLIGHNPVPGFLGVAVGALTLAWLLSRPTPGLGGVLTDAAIVTMFAMFFAKYAFINYYFVAFAAIWLAIATRDTLLDGDLTLWRLSAREPSAELPRSEPVGPVVA